MKLEIEEFPSQVNVIESDDDKLIFKFKDGHPFSNVAFNIYDLKFVDSGELDENGEEIHLLEFGFTVLENKDGHDLDLPENTGEIKNQISMVVGDLLHSAAKSL